VGGGPFLIGQRLAVPLLAVVFVLVLVWLAVNVRGWPAATRVAASVIALGAGLNGLVIAANGRMPYATAPAVRAGVSPGATTAKNEPARSGSRLGVLSDGIPVAALHAVVSPGDVLISVGGCVVIALAMRRKSVPRRHDV
jgi:hypothetical protein